MANRFTNIKLHLVFAFKGHEATIPEENLPSLFSYIAKSINSRGHHAIEVGGPPDHVHILFEYNPNDNLSDLIRSLKSASNIYIRENHLSPCNAQWQRGYGCFSVSCNNFEKTLHYIQNQKGHHTHTNVREELRLMLHMAGMHYDDAYLFD